MAERMYWTHYSIWEESVDGRPILKASPESVEGEEGVTVDTVKRRVAARQGRSAKLVVVGPYEVTYDDEITSKAMVRDRSVDNSDVAPPPPGFFDKLRKVSDGVLLDDTIGSSLSQKGTV